MAGGNTMGSQIGLLGYGCRVSPHLPEPRSLAVLVLILSYFVFFWTCKVMKTPEWTFFGVVPDVRVDFQQKFGTAVSCNCAWWAAGTAAFDPKFLSELESNVMRSS